MQARLRRLFPIHTRRVNVREPSMSSVYGPQHKPYHETSKETKQGNKFYIVRLFFLL